TKSFSGRHGRRGQVEQPNVDERLHRFVGPAQGAAVECRRGNRGADPNFGTKRPAESAGRSATEHETANEARDRRVGGTPQSRTPRRIRRLETSDVGRGDVFDEQEHPSWGPLRLGAVLES